MSAFRATGFRGFSNELQGPGDTLLRSEYVATETTNGAVTLAAAKMVAGYLYRSGSGAGYTDTFDTAVNIYNALFGSGSDPQIANGIGFKMRLVNSVAFLETITLGAGMVAGSGAIANVAASTWKDFYFQFLSVQKPLTLLANTTNGSPTVTLALSGSQTAALMGPSPLAVNIQSGAFVSGTGIPAATTVLGITQGPGGITGFTLSNNATATNTGVTLSIGPYLQVHGMGSGTL